MTDSKDNIDKSKPNHLHTVFDEKLSNVDADIEFEDQDAIDKLLVDTGFDAKQVADDFDSFDDFFKFDDFGDFDDSPVEPIPAEEITALSLEKPGEVVVEHRLDNNDEASDVTVLKTIDEFADIDDFSDFVDPIVEPLAVDDELLPIIDVPDELPGQDSIDQLLVETGFDDSLVLIDEFADIDEVSKPVLDEELIADEEIAPEIKDELAGQTSIEKLAAVTGFVNVEPPLITGNSVSDEFSDVSDFSDFAYPVLESISELIEETSPVVDEFGGGDEFAELAAEVNVLADAEIDERQNSLKLGVVDEFSDGLSAAVGEEALVNLIDDDSNDAFLSSDQPETALDEDALVAAQLALMGKSAAVDSDEFLALDEIGDDLFADSDASITASIDEFSEQSTGRNSDGENDFLLADFDITSDTDFPGLVGGIERNGAFSDNDFATPFEQISPSLPELRSEPVEELESIPKASLASDNVADNVQSDAIAQLKSEQERLDKVFKKQFADTEAKAKKTATLGYVALGLGIIALGLAGGMGWVAVTAKSELSPLSESVKTIQVDLNSQKPDQELFEVKATVEQLNQKIDGVVNQLQGPGASGQESLQGAALGSVIKPGELGTKEPGAKKDVVNKSLDIAPAHVSDGHAPSGSEHGAPTGADTGKSHDAPAKSEAVKTPEVAKPLAESAADEKKTLAPRSETKTGNSETSALKKKLSKTSHSVAQAKPLSHLDWSVNLIAFRQDWYAKSKASEYIQKGVPVEVVPVEISGVVWYRLRVSGFKNKAEADIYALRVKRALNLSSVWVGDI